MQDTVGMIKTYLLFSRSSQPNDEEGGAMEKPTKEEYRG